MATERTSQKSYISKVEKCKQKIREQPEKFLPKIGAFLVSETKRRQRKRTGRMKKELNIGLEKEKKTCKLGLKISTNQHLREEIKI